MILNQASLSKVSTLQDGDAAINNSEGNSCSIETIVSTL